jgi:hypothetical protein
MFWNKIYKSKRGFLLKLNTESRVTPRCLKGVFKEILVNESSGNRNPPQGRLRPLRYHRCRMSKPYIHVRL